MEKLPANVDAERFVLGSILLDDSCYDQAAGELAADDFSLDIHQRIFRRMGDLRVRGEKIDRVTVANELDRVRELEACGGLSYLVALDDGLPKIPKLDSYLRIIKDKAALRRIIFASQQMINHVQLGEKTPDEILTAAEEVFCKLAESRVRAVSSIGCDLSADVLRMAAERAQKWQETGKPVMGIESGLRRLDDMLNGLNPGLHLLAGGPGMGKTTACVQISVHACLQGTPVVYVTYENSPRNLILKAICARAGLVPRDIERGMAHSEHLRKLTATAQEMQPALALLEVIEGTMSLQLAEIRSKVAKALQRHNARTCLVIFDYLQRAAPAQGQKEVRTNVSALAGHLRDLATGLECPVLAISSQNRAEGNYGNGRGSASLTSLKESGDLEYSADTVMFLHANDQRMATHPAIAVDLTVAKNRFGPTGSVPLIFRANIGDFREEAR